MNDDPQGTIPHIRDAPRRVQREHYRRERRMNAIAISVLVLIASLIAYGICRLVR